MPKQTQKETNMNKLNLKKNVERKLFDYRNQIWNFITKMNINNEAVVVKVDHTSLEIPTAHISTNISSNIMYTIRNAAIKKMSVHIKNSRRKTKQNEKAI